MHAHIRQKTALCEHEIAFHAAGGGCRRASVCEWRRALRVHQRDKNQDTQPCVQGSGEPVLGVQV